MKVRTYLQLSIAVAVATILLKTGAWWISGSVSLLSDALESLVNLAGAMFALAMVTIAARPPDDDHPFGHHKAEYFSSGFEGVMIFAAALAIVVAAVQRLLQPQPLDAVGWGLVLSVLSSALNAALAVAMQRKARQVRSVALEADARHLFTDVWTSAGVVIGLLAVLATGWAWLDPVIAIAVALNILREGASLVWRSAGGLMDEALEPEVLALIDAVLARHAQASVRIDHVATRRGGSRRFADLHMHVPAHWTLGRAAALRGEVEQALMAAVPGLRASIQLLPLDVEAGSVAADQHEGAGRTGVIGLLQRVREARVDVDGAPVGAIGHGLLLLVCAEPADTPAQVARLLDKVLKLRIFADDAGKMNRSLQDVGGGLLVVSQFTLAADTSGGNRPSFTGAAPAALGRALYDTLLQLARDRHGDVQAGVFGADMQVHLVNDGPVTIPLRLC